MPAATLRHNGSRWNWTISPVCPHLLFSLFLSDEALQGIDKGRAARNLASFSGLLAKFEYLHHVTVLHPDYLTKNLRDLFNSFFRFLYDGGIDEYEDTSEYAQSGCVSIMTVHQSKGLEFPVVVIGSLGAVPRKQHSDLDELLENKYFSRPPFEPLDQTKYFDFRRLYYVGFSRAQNLLVLTCHEKAGKAPSRYFEDILYHLPHWRDPVFQPELMTFEPVKKINIKREYSFTSHITVYENCAEQYRIFKKLEFTPVRVSPMFFGTLVNQTIEDIHKAVLSGEAHNINPSQIAEWFKDNYNLISSKERVYLAPSTQKAALNHVMRYYERENQNWGQLREAEVRGRHIGVRPTQLTISTNRIHLMKTRPLGLNFF